MLHFPSRVFSFPPSGYLLCRRALSATCRAPPCSFPANMRDNTIVNGGCAHISHDESNLSSRSGAGSVPDAVEGPGPGSVDGRFVSGFRMRDQAAAVLAAQIGPEPVPCDRGPAPCA